MSLPRAVWVFLLVPAAAGPLSAAVWLDPNWALVGELRPSIAYDSNITARQDNISDTYETITPKLTLSRRGSATRLELEGMVEQTWFNDHHEFNSTDPRFNLLYAYPNIDGTDPTTQVDLNWYRNSEANTDLGRRIRSENLHGRWNQRVFNTGRTTGDLQIEGHNTDFLENDLNTNNAFSVDGRIGYAIAPQVRAGIGYGHDWTRSLGVLGRPDTSGNEDRITVRANGELFPKLRGTVETGVAFVRYRGAVNQSDTAWIAAVDLTWDASPSSVVSVRASRYTDFSPDGQTALRSEVMLNLTQKLAGGFALRLGGGGYRVRTSFDNLEHHADAVTALVGLSYQLTERFSAELTEHWTRQQADRDTLDYERHLATAAVAFLF